MQRQPRQRYIALVILFFTFVIFTLTIVAQDNTNPEQASFATNTPAPMGGSGSSGNSNSPFLATNTPIPEPTATPLPSVTPGPAASSFNYGLKIWLESELVTLAFDQIQKLNEGVSGADLALQLTLYELEDRFPGAPHNATQRIQLIEAMLQSPAGTIDMRSIVRPLIAEAVNAQPDSTLLEVEGFAVGIQPVNLDNRGQADALVHIVYTSMDEFTLYDDYILALRNADNSLQFLEGVSDFVAAPFNGVEQITLEQIDDVNDDAIDEVVLRVDDGRVNDRLFILGHRNGAAIDLAQPEAEIRFGEIVNWTTDNTDTDNPVINVLEYATVSSPPNWNCRSSRPVIWTYERNFYRPSFELNTDFENVDSLGCALLEEEPLFALPPAEAIGIIESALLDYGFEAESADRALMNLAMLYVLQGRLADAQTTAQTVIPAGDEDSWTSRQGNALLMATGVSSNTALDICAALAQASLDPACDMNSVLGRYLEALELTTEDDLVEQLESAGLPVFETVTRSSVGFADRTVVSFLLVDTDWWGFVAQRDGLYKVEPADPPAGFEEAIFPQAQVEVPQSAYDALFINNNPTGVLTILNNLENENPDVPFRPDGLYLRALVYDLTASREEARLAYYDIWERYADTVWGELAARHLVQR